MIIKNNKGNAIDLASLSREELLDLRIEIEKEAARMDATIYETQRKARVEGDWSDPDWYNRLMTARKMKGKSVNAINMELSKRRKARAQSYERIFMEKAKKMLDLTTYLAIEYAAKEEAEEQPA